MGTNGMHPTGDEMMPPWILLKFGAVAKRKGALAVQISVEKVFDSRVEMNIRTMMPEMAGTPGMTEWTPETMAAMMVVVTAEMVETMAGAMPETMDEMTPAMTAGGTTETTQEMTGGSMIETMADKMIGAGMTETMIDVTMDATTTAEMVAEMDAIAMT